MINFSAFLTLLATATLGVGTVAWASPTVECRVQLVPAGSSGAWVAAATALDSQLRRSAPGDRDCQEVIVNTAPNRATVAVLTADGRRAVRPLDSADDLAPTVEGLIVTIPSDSARAADAVVSTQPAVAESRTADGAGLLLMAAGGGRLSFPGTLAAFVVDAGAGIKWSHYELALSGVWSRGRSQPSNENGPASTPSSLEVGADFGRRQAVGFGDIIAGVRGGAIRTAGSVWTADADVSNNNRPPPFHVFPFVGAYTAFAFFPSSAVRIRPQFLFQWLPTTAQYEQSVGASVPSWSLTVSIGAESGIL